MEVRGVINFQGRWFQMFGELLSVVNIRKKGEKPVVIFRKYMDLIGFWGCDLWFQTFCKYIFFENFDQL